MDSSSALAKTPAEPEVIAERYQVESALGEGGMGAVFQVRDLRSDRRVALKRLRAKEGSTARVWFEREYFTLAELAHPRIIEVYDYGIHEDGAYYTMELLDGADLRERRNLSVEQVCAVLCDVACSLAILHSRGLLHRDVSPRNVRCTTDGRAKLIDFGAMAPMGMTHDVVGTPPCTPPEVLQLQVLDGRADLYALGVLAYWMLAGRYPYPARTMMDLPDLWFGTVPQLDRVAPDVPEPLAQLVMQLISLEADGRPRTAGEVTERLSAIAGLTLDDRERMAVAFLTRPRLVGRKLLVAWARDASLSLQQRRGGTVVIEGEPGVGRTRGLDACVAEVKRVGGVVVRATASHGASRDFGVIATLFRQLMLELPDSAARLGAQERAILAPILPELRRADDPDRPIERRHVQAAFRDWLLVLARQHRVMLAVDDIEHVDEPSAALLGMLAHDIDRRSLLIAVTRTAGEGVGLAVDVLTRLGKSFQLAALSEAETEELVRSVFGDVQNVVVVAQRLHDVARGNPRDTMQLLRHLVECGLAHYEGAAWLLPQELAESDLPSSMLSAFDARLASVSAEARSLAEALALTDPAWISLQDYSDLMDGLDTGRLFSALGALVQAGVLLPEGDRYRFSVRSAASHLEARMAPERKRALHARLAGLAERRGAPIRRVHHLLESGQETLAIDDLVNKIGTDALDYSNHTVDLLERAIAAGERLDVLEVSRLSMKLRLAGVSAITANLPVFLRHAPDALRRLRRDTGLDDWQELGDAMPAGERLKTAFQRARERYLATPERQRGFPLDESIRRLSRLIGGYTAMAAAAIDCELLLDLPSLRPFFPIAPATAIVQSLVDAQILLEGGKVGEARAAYSSVISRAADPSVEIEPIFREQIKYNVAHGIAGIDARAARESALTIADELDKVPQHRANAWHIRRSYYRMLGQIEKVRESQRRIELLQLRDGPQPRVLNFRTDLPACWLSDDLTGLKSSLSAVEAEAVRFPRVRVLKELAYCHYHRLRGEYEAALERLTEAMDIARPGRHRDWHHIAAAHVELLTLLGREDEAIGQASDYEVLFTKMGIDQGLLGLGLSHARALLAAGRFEEARERCDKVLKLHEDYGAGGVLLARCHETRARVALALDDKTGFDYWAARFAEFSLVAENPAIRAQYERLMQKGSAGEGPLEVVPEGDLFSTALEQVRSGTVNDRLANCIDQTERLRAALSMALDACGAKRGHLFGVRDGALVPLSSAPDSDPPAALRQALVALFEEERRGEELTAVVEEGATSVHAAAYTRVLDLGFAARMLLAHRAGDPAIVGVIAIEQRPGQARVVPPRVAEAIAEALTARGDVDPITCFIG